MSSSIIIISCLIPNRIILKENLFQSKIYLSKEFVTEINCK